MSASSTALTKAAEELVRVAMVQSESSMLGELKSIHSLMENVAQNTVAMASGIEELKQHTASGIEELKQHTAFGIEEAKQRSESEIEEVKQRSASEIEEVKQRSASEITELRQRSASEIEELKQRSIFEGSKLDAHGTIKVTADAIRPLVDAISKQTEAINRQNRTGSLQWAIANVDKYTFFRSTTIEKCIREASSNQITKDLVIDMLQSFLGGCGYYVDNYIIDDDLGVRRISEGNFTSEQKKHAIDAAKERFQFSLINLVHKMTGAKPTVRLTNGRHYIFLES